MNSTLLLLTTSLASELPLKYLLSKLILWQESINHERHLSRTSYSYAEPIYVMRKYAFCSDA